MNKDDLIPALDVGARTNPMIWEGEEQAEGVFLSTGQDEALALLGMPSMAPPPPPRLPEDFSPSAALRSWLDELSQSLASCAREPEAIRRLAFDSLAPLDIQAIEEILGTGEVDGSVTLDGVRYQMQESVLAGVWLIHGDNGQRWVEVAAAPSIVLHAADSLEVAEYEIPAPAGEVMNAPAVLAEIAERARQFSPQTAAPNHVLNFTLLPMSEADHALLTGILGRADLELRSGGFGDCHILATRYRHVWAVQFVNAMGHTILDTIEIGCLPAAARAASEDFEDSSERLGELLEAYLT